MNDRYQFPKSSLEEKRLQLLIAFMNLGIDSKSFSMFLREAIELEQQHLHVTAPLLTEHEINFKKRAIMQADLVKLILEHF